MYICCLTLCVREPVTHGRPVCRSYYVTLPSPLATVSPYPHHCHITLANRPTSLLTLRCTQLASYTGKSVLKYMEHKCVPLHHTSYKTTSPAIDIAYPTLRLSIQKYPLDYTESDCLGERGSVGWRQRRNAHTCCFIFIIGDFAVCCELNFFSTFIFTSVQAER